MRKVMMTVVPNHGSPTVSEISESLAVEMRNNAFMRPGSVVVTQTEHGVTIKDQNGQTILVLLDGEDA